MNNPPRVVPLKTAITLASTLWSTYLVLAFAIVNPMFQISIEALHWRVVAGVILGMVLGSTSGWVDWRWNRTPYYSQWKKRWFNQTGYTFPVSGAIAGLLLAMSGVLQVTSHDFGDGPLGGALLFGMVGIGLGLVYRILTTLWRFIAFWKESR